MSIPLLVNNLEEKMKIVSVLGSPRAKSNSSTVAKRFMEIAEKSGAETKTFVLNKLKFRGCQACMTCKTKLEKCVLKDDLAEVLDSVAEADVLVMATPVYYGDISAQLKMFVDRTFSYLTPDFHTNPNRSRLDPGKKLVFIQSQGQADAKMFCDIYPKYKGFFQWYGFEGNEQILILDGNNPKAVDADEVVKKTEEIAAKI